MSFSFTVLTFTITLSRPNFKGQNSLPRFTQGQFFLFVTFYAYYKVNITVLEYLKSSTRRLLNKKPLNRSCFTSITQFCSCLFCWCDCSYCCCCCTSCSEETKEAIKLANAAGVGVGLRNQNHPNPQRYMKYADGSVGGGQHSRVFSGLSGATTSHWNSTGGLPSLTVNGASTNMDVSGVFLIAPQQSGPSQHRILRQRLAHMNPADFGGDIEMMEERDAEIQVDDRLFREGVGEGIDNDGGGGGGGGVGVMAMMPLALVTIDFSTRQSSGRIVIDYGDGILVNYTDSDVQGDDTSDVQSPPHPPSSTSSTPSSQLDRSALSKGSHAFVRCFGEPFIRCTLESFEFGSAGGHPLLANFSQVLMAGEIEVDEKGVITRWLNKSGLYMPPKWVLGQAGLPFELAWLFLTESDVNKMDPIRRDVLQSSGSLVQLSGDSERIINKSTPHRSQCQCIDEEVNAAAEGSMTNSDDSDDNHDAFRVPNQHVELYQINSDNTSINMEYRHGSHTDTAATEEEVIPSKNSIHIPTTWILKVADDDSWHPSVSTSVYVGAREAVAKFRDLKKSLLQHSMVNEGVRSFRQSAAPRLNRAVVPRELIMCEDEDASSSALPPLSSCPPLPPDFTSNVLNIPNKMKVALQKLPPIKTTDNNNRGRVDKNSSSEGINSIENRAPAFYDFDDSSCGDISNQYWRNLRSAATEASLPWNESNLQDDNQQHIIESFEDINTLTQYDSDGDDVREEFRWIREQMKLNGVFESHRIGALERRQLKADLSFARSLRVDGSSIALDQLPSRQPLPAAAVDVSPSTSSSLSEGKPRQ